MNMEKSLNCYEMCVNYICECYQLDFYLWFASGWRFNYNEKYKVTLGKRELDTTINYMEKYHGLRMEIYSENDDFKNNLYIINEINENQKKIVVGMDSFYCPWHKAHKKLHIAHYCIIQEYRNSDNSIICLDPYLSSTPQIISTENFTNGIYWIVFFEKLDIYGHLEPVEILKDMSYNEQYFIQMFEMMLSFANDMRSITNPNDIFDYKEDIYLCSNVMNLKVISDSRYNLSYLFEKLSKDPFYFNIATLFKKCAENFKVISSLIIKLYYKPHDLENMRNKIFQKVLQIVDLEKLIFNSIKSYLGKDTNE